MRLSTELEETVTTESEKLKHNTGFKAWKRRSDCDSTKEWLRSGYDAFMQDGPFWGTVTHGLDAIGIGAWGAVTGYIAPMLAQYIPLAEMGAAYSATVAALPLGLETIVAGAANGLVLGAAFAAEALVVGGVALGVGYLAFKLFDAMGDNYRPQRALSWLWDHTGKTLYNGVKNTTVKTGRGIKTRALKTYDRVFKKNTLADYNLSRDFEEALHTDIGAEYLAD